MNITATVLLAFGMSMDAFAASIGKGATLHKPKFSEAVRTGLIFGAIETLTPLVGWGLAAMKMISIDRKAGKDALRQVIDQGCERLKAGYWVVIFPEGTRVAPGEKRRFKTGGAHLAVASGALLVPVAHNAGEFWARNAFVKNPGVITVSIGPAIDPIGRTADEITAIAEQWVDAEMRRISPHRYPDVGASA